MAKYYVPHPDDIETDDLEDTWNEVKRISYLYRIEQFLRTTAPGGEFEDAWKHKRWQSKKKEYLNTLNPFYFAR